MLQIKEHLKTNEFKPLFDSIDFGRLYLFQYPYDPFKSQILNGNQSKELVKLCEFSLSVQQRLIYRGTENGFEAKDFHARCDGHQNTMTILRSQHEGYIFGGYTEASWSSLSQRAEWKFLFSLINRCNRPCKMRVKNVARAIYCVPKCGPIFGVETLPLRIIQIRPMIIIQIWAQHTNIHNTLLEDKMCFHFWWAHSGFN